MTYNISMKKPADNFFLSYWRGELGLGASFWGIFVFLSILVTGLLGMSMDYIPKQISFSLLTAFMIYTCVGLYQSNIKHESHGFITFILHLCVLSRLIKAVIFLFATISSF